MFWTKIIVITTIFGYSQGGLLPMEPGRKVKTNDLKETTYDFFMDLILDGLKLYLEGKNETKIAIPPIDTGFEYDVIGIPFTGSFKTSNGIFSNPATIKRQGDVDVKDIGNNVIASMTVTFTDLEVYFPEYTAEVVGISESGQVYVKINDNSIFMEITIRYLPKCVVNISKLQMKKMSNIDVDITGLGFLNPLEDDIIAWVLSSYRTFFVSIVEKTIHDKLEVELAKTKICHLKKN